MQKKLADETATMEGSMSFFNCQRDSDIEGRFGTEKSNNNSDN